MLRREKFGVTLQAKIFVLKVFVERNAGWNNDCRTATTFDWVLLHCSEFNWRRLQCSLGRTC